MTLVKGPGVKLPWIKRDYNHVTNTSYHQDPIKGAIMITSGCMGWAAFVILQVSIQFISYIFNTPTKKKISLCL